MNKKQIEKKKKELEERFNKLTKAMSQKQKEFNEMNTERVKIQGQYELLEEETKEIDK